MHGHLWSPGGNHMPGRDPWGEMWSRLASLTKVLFFFHVHLLAMFHVMYNYIYNKIHWPRPAWLIDSQAASAPAL